MLVSSRGPSTWKTLPNTKNSFWHIRNHGWSLIPARNFFSGTSTLTPRQIISAILPYKRCMRSVVQPGSRVFDTSLSNVYQPFDCNRAQRTQKQWRRRVPAPVSAALKGLGAARRQRQGCGSQVAAGGMIARSNPATDDGSDVWKARHGTVCEYQCLLS